MVTAAGVRVGLSADARRLWVAPTGGGGGGGPVVYSDEEVRRTPGVSLSAQGEAAYCGFKK